MMIPRFVPLKPLISNNIDQVRPLGRWKGACCRWISWLWSTWPVRSELLWGGHNPLIWVLMAFIYLFVFSLSHHVLFGFIRGELLTWTWSFFLNLISLAWVVFVCWWLQQILPTWSTWLTGVWPHHNDLDRDWESARGNGWKRTCRHQQGALGRPGLGGDQVKHEDGDLIRDCWRFHLAGVAHRRLPAGFIWRWHGQLLWSAQVITCNKK